MAFGMKNGEATYQKCIHIILDPQIGRNVEAYIDDVIVKLKKCGDLLDDLKETFGNLRKYKMMLNPKKACSVYHQGNCSTTWYHHGESTQTQRRWKSSNSCNHLGPEKKSRSWQT
jgi:type VI protein secretion system component VasK